MVAIISEDATVTLKDIVRTPLQASDLKAGLTIAAGTALRTQEKLEVKDSHSVHISHQNLFKPTGSSMIIITRSVHQEWWSYHKQL